MFIFSTFICIWHHCTLITLNASPWSASVILIIKNILFFPPHGHLASPAPNNSVSNNHIFFCFVLQQSFCMFFMFKDKEHIFLSPKFIIVKYEGTSWTPGRWKSGATMRREISALWPFSGSPSRRPNSAKVALVARTAENAIGFTRQKSLTGCVRSPRRRSFEFTSDTRCWSWWCSVFPNRGNSTSLRHHHMMVLTERCPSCESWEHAMTTDKSPKSESCNSLIIYFSHRVFVYGWLKPWTCDLKIVNVWSCTVPYKRTNFILCLLFNDQHKKHLKNVGLIRHCEPPHTH